MISFFVRSNRFIIYKKWGTKEILCGAPLYFLNYTLWGKVANFTSSGMRSTYSLITSYQTSSEILTNKIVDPNLLKIWLRENNNSTRLKSYPCPYLTFLLYWLVYSISTLLLVKTFTNEIGLLFHYQFPIVFDYLIYIAKTD